MDRPTTAGPVTPSVLARDNNPGVAGGGAVTTVSAMVTGASVVAVTIATAVSAPSVVVVTGPR
jgi:hypothetical protein